MKILFVTDKVVDRLYSSYVRQMFDENVSLLVSCGDLPYYYLDYLQSMLNVSLLYVHGNHDVREAQSNGRDTISEPLGGVNLHQRVVFEKGLLFAGLEGSIRYRPRAKYQYSQRDMWMMALRLAPKLWFNKQQHGRYLDVFVTHSPAFGIHNGPDRAHVGFHAFMWLLRTFKPRYMIHGHRHVYNRQEVTKTVYEETTILNVYPYQALDM